MYNKCIGNSNKKCVPDSSTLYGHATYSLNEDGDIDIIKLDDLEKELSPIGFIHIDTEGWEKHVLLGANNILLNPLNKMYIISEYWGIGNTKLTKDKGYCKGIISDNPRKELLKLTKKYNCKVMEILRCEETNLVFTVNINKI